MTRFNWTHDFPHLRPVHITSLNPTDTNQLNAVQLSAVPPSIIILSSTLTQSARVLDSARDKAIKHGTPLVVCASSPTGPNSGLIDSWGRILFQQHGGETWSLNTGLEYSYHTGQGRDMTGYERLGDFGAVAVFTCLLISIVLASHASKLFNTGRTGFRQTTKCTTATESDGILGWIARVREHYSSISSVRTVESSALDPGSNNVPVPATASATDSTWSSRSD